MATRVIRGMNVSIEGVSNPKLQRIFVLRPNDFMFNYGDKHDDTHDDHHDRHPKYADHREHHRDYSDHENTHYSDDNAYPK